MQLFYSGALTPEEVQIHPDLSLGGYKSSSLIANGRIGNLFSTITNSLLRQRREIRLIVLQNLTGETKEVKIWTQSTPISTLKIAAVSPTVEGAFERVADMFSLPFQATLEAHEEAANALDFSISADEIVGLWILRELDVSLFNTSNNDVNWSDSNEVAAYLTKLHDNVAENDEMSVVIDWS